MNHHLIKFIDSIYNDTDYTLFYADDLTKGASPHWQGKVLIIEMTNSLTKNDTGEYIPFLFYLDNKPFIANVKVDENEPHYFRLFNFWHSGKSDFDNIDLCMTTQPPERIKIVGRIISTFADFEGKYIDRMLNYFYPEMIE